jgi:hypothetical protein
VHKYRQTMVNDLLTKVRRPASGALVTFAAPSFAASSAPFGVANEHLALAARLCMRRPPREITSRAFQMARQSSPLPEDSACEAWLKTRLELATLKHHTSIIPVAIEDGEETKGNVAGPPPGLPESVGTLRGQNCKGQSSRYAGSALCWIRVNIIPLTHQKRSVELPSGGLA